MGLPGDSGPSRGARPPKRARQNTYHEDAARGSQYDEYRNELGTNPAGPQEQQAQWALDAATKGINAPGGPQGMGSAWEGQHQSLATDAFVHHDFTSMRDDIHQKIATSSHVMAQGGNICDTWTAIPAFANVLDISMGMLTGNQLMGGANMFNQYYLCKLKGFKVIFKDIIVALEASTNVGLTTMADVTTEWRRRPAMARYVPNAADPLGRTNPPDQTQYPDWWQDWRPATDGAVEFYFDVNTRRVPTVMANARPGNSTNPRSVVAGNYRTLRQFLFGYDSNYVFSDGNIVDSTGPAASLVPSQEFIAWTWEYMDYFFEWRARNCPNATSGTNTSARYNIQIDAIWEMSHRVTASIDTRFNPGSAPPRKPNVKSILNDCEWEDEED